MQFNVLLNGESLPLPLQTTWPTTASTFFISVCFFDHLANFATIQSGGMLHSRNTNFLRLSYLFIFGYFSHLIHYIYQHISVLSTPLHFYNALCYMFTLFFIFLKVINNGRGIGLMIQSERAGNIRKIGYTQPVLLLSILIFIYSIFKRHNLLLIKQKNCGCRIFLYIFVC